LNAVQLNNSEQIAAVDRVSGSPPSFLLRTWNANSPGTFTLIARSPSTAFQIVYSDPGLSNSSNVVFSASDPSFNDLLATPNAAKNPPYNELPMSVPLRPQIADNGTVVVREGNTTTSPIVLLDNNLDSATAVTIASTASFNSLGESPGISRDGVVVAFAGDMNTTGASQWKTNPGPGIFAAIIQKGALYKIVRVAGFTTASGGVGTKLIEAPGVPWCDPKQTCVPSGELEDLPPVTKPTRVYFNTFTASGFAASTEWQSRIAVTHGDFGLTGIDGDTIVVSFLATPNMSDSTGLGLFTANSGIWTVRADLFQAGTSLLTHVYRPVPVMQLNDPLGTGSTVTGLTIYDQLANQLFADSGLVRTPADGDHRVAFWASTSSGAQMIIRGTYIQQFGVSGGNSTDITKTTTGMCCASGTLGSLVQKSGTKYILSNDHVLGKPQSATKNAAAVGDPVSDPGLIDYGPCKQPHSVAKFASAPTLSTGIDAALAGLTPDQMNTTGSIYNIGVPSSTILAPAMGMPVAKQGRTTGLTCGKIAGVNMTVTINYQPSCSTTKFPVKFVGQILITSTTAPFSIPGDSGSLIVSQSTAQPVGLLFAGQSTTSPYTTWATPSSTVASKLGITFVGGTNHSVTACHGTFLAPLSASETERVAVVQSRYETELMNNPAVLAVGVGAADDNPFQGVILIVVDRSKPYTPPLVLDGVRTKIILSDPIYARLACSNSGD
jgi:hypothetical protein